MITSENIVDQSQSCLMTVNYEVIKEMDGTQMEEETESQNMYPCLNSEIN